MSFLGSGIMIYVAILLILIASALFYCNIKCSKLIFIFDSPKEITDVNVFVNGKNITGRLKEGPVGDEYKLCLCRMNIYFKYSAGTHILIKGTEKGTIIYNKTIHPKRITVINVP